MLTWFEPCAKKAYRQTNSISSRITVVSAVPTHTLSFLILFLSQLSSLEIYHWFSCIFLKMYNLIWDSFFFLFHCTSPYCIMKTITVPLLESYLRQCFPNLLTVASLVTGYFHVDHFFLEFKIICPLAPATLSLRAFPPHCNFDFWNTIALFVAESWTPIPYRPLPCVLCELSFQTLATNTFHHYSKLPYLTSFFKTSWLPLNQ